MTTATDTRRSLVTCRAAGERFALDVGSVERVLRYSPPRALPNSAAWLRGVLSVGERLVPVLDLRERLGLPATTPVDASRIVVLALPAGRIGFVVDAVDDVVGIDAAAVAPPPPVYRGLAKAYVEGIVQREDRLYILLDPEQLVTSQERLAMVAAVEDLYHGR
jgi:purine-binding chemotaxis protein CheW